MQLTKKEIEILSVAGSQAPSGGNAQPWKVDIFSERIEIFLEEKRANNFLDVGKFASYFGLGCFLENILIAAESLGLTYKVEFDKSKEKPPITVVFLDREKNNKSILYPFIEKRATNRKLYDGQIIPEKQLQNLKNLVSSFNPGYKLSFVSNFDDKIEVSDALGIADGIRYTHAELFKQMMMEFRYTMEEVTSTKDGLDLNTLELPENGKKLFNLLNKYSFITDLIPIKAFQEMARPLLLNSSHLVCLSTSLPLENVTLIQAGQIIERIWLTCTKDSIWLHPWSVVAFFIIRVKYFGAEGFSQNETKQIKDIEKKLHEVFELNKNDLPLFTFRLSYAQAPSARSLKLDWKEYTTLH